MKLWTRLLIYTVAFLLSYGLFSAPGVAKAWVAPTQPVTQATPAGPANLTATLWEGEVWQSLRSGNWELYYGLYSATPIQLTNHPAADTLPRLNRGSTKVAFVSNRDGNDEIYVINTDGTGLTRLTFDGAQDTLPYWSPDGTKLIFTSQRTGNGDLYLMNANGSGLRQLTSDSADDSYPTWSPDGTQLLWVRLYPIIKARPQEGELWVADADGANARALTGRLQRPARPLISPNGALIALDADLAQNGLPDIVIMNRDGTNAYRFVQSDVGILRWTGTWDLDSSALWVTKFTYLVSGGNWTLQYTDIKRHCLDNRPGCETLIPGDRQAMMPDRQLADLVAPSSRVEPLPAYTRLDRFLVSWSGKESGPSGLMGFHLQYRRDGENSWRDWFDGTNPTPGPFPVTPVQEQGMSLFTLATAGKYYFRSRANDQAGNFEAWPAGATGDAQTTAFQWYLAGQVTDSRGVPYALQPLALQPAALEPLVTDLQGKFQVHIGQSGDYTLEQTTTLRLDKDRVRTYYHLPTANTVLNGGFEQPLTSSQWQISGTVGLTQQEDLVHSGAQAVQLGQRCPDPCLTTLPGSGVISRWQQALLVDPNGNLHHWTVVAPNTLIHQIRTPEGRWLPYVALANGISNWTPATLFDQSGNLHLVWSASGVGLSGPEETLYYALYRSGQGWSTPETIGPGANPRLAIDAQQQLHLIYRCSNSTDCQPFRLAYRKRDSTGTWSPQKVLNTNDFLTKYAIATTGNTVHVSWAERSNQGGLESLFAAILIDGLLRNLQLVDVGVVPSTGLGLYDTLQLLTDQQQTLHLAWTVSLAASLYYTHKPLDGSWQAVEQLRYGTDEQPISRLTMLLDRQNLLHFITPRYFQVPSLHWRRNAAGSWLPVEPLTIFPNNYYQLTAVALGHHDELYFALENSEPTALLKTTATLTATQRSQIAQPLLIPANLHQPTLAFLYQLTGGSDTSAFTLAVDAGITITTIFSATAANGWQLGWGDLTPWQGQTITVTFSLIQAAGDSYRQALLDEVSLGAWTTPLPQAVTPNRLTWGAGGTLTITGSNFIATPQIYLGDHLLLNPVWVDAQTLTVAVPTDLGPGRYDLWVVNPSGARMLLANGVAVGEQVYLPLVNR